MSRCDGIIVVHNALLPASSCAKSDADSIYVLFRSIGFFTDFDPVLKNRLLAEAKKPSKIIAAQRPGVGTEPYADDLAVLIFEDNMFLELLAKPNPFLVASLYEPEDRPVLNANGNF